MRRNVAMAVAAALFVLAACVHSEQPQPQSLRTPRRITDIVGIWRTIHQNTLQLRSDGTFLLVTSVANPLTGDYTLDAGNMDVEGTPACRGVSGSYTVQVAYHQRLVLRAVADPCQLRRPQLTVDAFIYSNS